MGLSLQLTITKPPGRAWYASLDTICGIVHVRSTKPVAISRICVHLEGRLSTSIKPRLSSDANIWVTCNHQLLSQRVVVFETDSRASRDSKLPQNGSEQCFLFSLRVPLLTSLWEPQSSKCPGTQCELPPTFNVASSTLKASASYRVRVAVLRPGILKRNRTIFETVTLRPLRPPEIQPPGTPRYLVLTEYFPGGVREAQGAIAGAEPSPPPYSPAVTLNVGLPANRVIRPGDHLDMKLELRIPQQMQQSLDAFCVSHLSVRIQARTTVKVSDHEDFSDYSIAVCSCEGHVPLELPAELEFVTIPAALWEHHRYPLITPSFTCANVRRTHRLQIKLGLASSSSSDGYDLMVAVDVSVGAGPASSPITEQHVLGKFATKHAMDNC